MNTNKITTRNKQSTLMRKLALAVCIGTASTMTMNTFAQNESMGEKFDSVTEETKLYFNNGLRAGKIETALLFNENLNNFDIDVEVEGQQAMLRGNVSSEIEKELAEEISLSVDGVEEVQNLLLISNNPETKQSEGAEGDGFLTAVEDASISARVKMKLLANEFVDGMDIDVNTNGNVVKLEGSVSTEAERDLAEKLVENIEDVESVENELTVRNS